MRMIEELKRILVAEEHLASRQLLERYLELWGYQVTVAADGSEALRHLESPVAPCIALLDWSMPRVDGLEVCRRVRSKPDRPFQYLMLLTAKLGKGEILAGETVGADDLVFKPFVIDELRARVRLAQRVVALERRMADVERQFTGIHSELNELRGLLPICPGCGQRKEDPEYFQMASNYHKEHPDTGTETSLCPACHGPAAPVSSPVKG
jgi:sigma-B regulation protein RsbU (phosphoserine phosphatase)